MFGNRSVRLSVLRCMTTAPLPRGRRAALALAGMFLLAAPAAAQQPLPPLRAKVEKVEVGFQGMGGSGPVFKAGLWALGFTAGLAVLGTF